MSNRDLFAFCPPDKYLKMLRGEEQAFPLSGHILTFYYTTPELGFLVVCQQFLFQI